MAINETKRIILAAAAARDDLHALPIPEAIKVNAVALEKTLNQMLRAGLLSEMAAGAEDRVWRQSEAGEKTMLVVTPAGLAAIGVGAVSAPTPKPHTLGKARGKAPTPAKPTQDARGATSGRSRGAGSKQDILVAMLRKGGASIADLAAATGWQQHSVRGVLTATIKGRLKLPLVSEKGEDGVRRYHIAALRAGEGQE